MNNRILFVVNCPAFFISHRLPLALAAKMDGYDIHVATMLGKESNQITAAGLTHHTLPLTRSGKNLFNELAVFIAIYKLFRQVRPELVHLVTIKPVLYGGIVARIVRIPSVVAAVSGLGFVFIAKGFKALIVRTGIKILYRIAFGQNNLRVIFQNSDDSENFVKIGLVCKDKVVLIRGSGVELTQFRVKKEPDGHPVIIMAARLLKDKGVNEFVEAATRLRKKGVKARFLLVGKIDQDNPATVTKNELDKIRKDGQVELLGHRTDIPELFAASNIVVLPSYREGLPKVLIEAAAAGRPIVTTDVPGCRDAIEKGISGLLVPVCDSTALAEAIMLLINNAEMRKTMGKEGRRLAEREFTIDKIVEAHMNIYRELKKVHGKK
jgi:glycosyltransferase involved in cell wall biosynthesis